MDRKEIVIEMRTYLKLINKKIRFFLTLFEGNTTEMSVFFKLSYTFNTISSSQE